ncbi:MAG: anthranilate phosphoribosyltransferase [Lachnospiraceae bacterium]|nr:anthranilate phosphoribosyltransferase [Lachnospiraceae bacterium]
MIQEAIGTLIKNEDLTYDTAAAVMDEIMSGTATDAQKAAFLTALHLKGENIEEITACASIMRKYCAIFDNTVPEVIDIVGTGGDCAGTFNISTLASIVVSAAGAKVAKHGNRAASSKCGTADVLEHLGVNLMADAKVSQRALEELGICFLFAQKYHTAMRFVGSVRKEIKIPTIFNMLGPLANPAKANLQLLGVYNKDLVEPLARVLSKLGVKRGMVVHGNDGLDEISMCDTTTVCEFKEGNFETYELDPVKYGFTLCKAEDLVGGMPEENAKIIKNTLSGQKDAKRDAVVLNAGAALHITNQISMEDGIELAKDMIDSGKAMKQLEKFIAITNA